MSGGNNLQGNIIPENNEHAGIEVVRQNAEHFDKMYKAYLDDLRKNLIIENTNNKILTDSLYVKRKEKYDEMTRLSYKFEGKPCVFNVAEYDKDKKPIFSEKVKDENGNEVVLIDLLIEKEIFTRDESDNSLLLYSTSIDDLEDYFKKDDQRLKDILDSVEKQKKDAKKEYHKAANQINEIDRQLSDIPTIFTDEELQSIDSVNIYRTRSLKKEIMQYYSTLKDITHVAYLTSGKISTVAGRILYDESDENRKKELETEWNNIIKPIDDLYNVLNKIDKNLKNFKDRDHTDIKYIHEDIETMVEDLNVAQDMLAAIIQDSDFFRKEYITRYRLAKDINNDDLQNHFFEKMNDLELLTRKVYQLDEHLSNIADGRLFVPHISQETENSKKIIRIKEVNGEASAEEIEKLRNEGYELVKTPTDSDNKESQYTSYKYKPLFPHEPKPGDIIQPYLGNCYLVAALNSIVHQDPDRIHDLIVDNNDGTCTVKFYNSSYEPIYVTVDKTLPANIYDNGLETPLWQEMITKAYVVSGLHRPEISKEISKEKTKEKSKGIDKNGLKEVCYHDIEGGRPNLFLNALLGPNIDGSAADFKSIEIGTDYDNNKPYNEGDLDTVKNIENALKEGKYVAAATKLSFEYMPTEIIVFDEEQQIKFDEYVAQIDEKTKNNEPNRKNTKDEKQLKNERSGIYTKHAYTITGIERDLEDGKIYVDLLNPHASGGVVTGDDGKLHYIEKDKAKGHMKLELKDYNKYFRATYVYNVDVTKEKKANAIAGKEFARDYYDVITNISNKLSDTENFFTRSFNSKEFSEFRDALKSAADELNSPLANKEIIKNKMGKLFEKAKTYQNRCENVDKIDKNLNNASFKDVQRYKMSKMIDEVQKIYNKNTVFGLDLPCDFRMISNEVNIPTNGYQEMKKIENACSKIKARLDDNSLPPKYQEVLFKSVKDIIKNSSVLDKNIGSKSDKNQLSYVKDNENALVAAEFFVKNYDFVKERFKDIASKNDNPQNIDEMLKRRHEEIRIKLENFKLNSDRRTYQIEHPGLDYNTFTPRQKNQPAKPIVQDNIQL